MILLVINGIHPIQSFMLLHGDPYHLQTPKHQERTHNKYGHLVISAEALIQGLHSGIYNGWLCIMLRVYLQVDRAHGESTWLSWPHISAYHHICFVLWMTCIHILHRYRPPITGISCLTRLILPTVHGLGHMSGQPWWIEQGPWHPALYTI